MFSGSTLRRLAGLADSTNVQGRASLATWLSLTGALAVLAVLSSACASTGTPRPRTPASLGARVADAGEEVVPPPMAESDTPASAEPAPPPSAAAAPPAAPHTSKPSRGIVETAMKLRGVPYRAGG